MPHDQLVQDIVAKIDADRAVKEQELKDLDAMRAYVLRFNGKLPEQAKLFEQSPNGHPIQGPKRPVAKIGVANSNSNRGLFRAILRDSGKSMTAKQVWAEAQRRGAVTTSNNPLNATHGSLHAMIGKGVKRTGKGRYAYDAATAPTEEEAAVES